jgi:elongation factor P
LFEEGTNVMVQGLILKPIFIICWYAASVVLEVTYSEPGVKGNTSTNATKPL